MLWEYRKFFGVFSSLFITPTRYSDYNDFLFFRHEIILKNALLAKKLDKAWATINLKGVGVGNALINPAVQFDSYIKYLEHNPYNVSDFVDSFEMDQIKQGSKLCTEFVKLCAKMKNKCTTAK